MLGMITNLRPMPPRIFFLHILHHHSWCRERKEISKECDVCLIWDTQIGGVCGWVCMYESTNNWIKEEIYKRD